VTTRFYNAHSNLPSQQVTYMPASQRPMVVTTTRNLTKAIHAAWSSMYQPWQHHAADTKLHFSDGRKRQSLKKTLCSRAEEHFKNPKHSKHTTVAGQLDNQTTYHRGRNVCSFSNQSANEEKVKSRQWRQERLPAIQKLLH